MVDLSTHINPDTPLFGGEGLVPALRPVQDLRRRKGEHILATLEQRLSGSIIGTRLALVETLKGILLVAFGIPVMGLKEAGVYEKPQ